MHLIKRGLQFPEEKTESKQKPSLEIGSQFRKQVHCNTRTCRGRFLIGFPFNIVIFVYVVNFLSVVIFVFLLFLGMAMYANEVETKDK